MEASKEDAGKMIAGLGEGMKRIDGGGGGRWGRGEERRVDGVSDAQHLPV
jgi:hypothetical protein